MGIRSEIIGPPELAALKLPGSFFTTKRNPAQPIRNLHFLGSANSQVYHYHESSRLQKQHNAALMSAAASFYHTSQSSCHAATRRIGYQPLHH